MKIQIISYINRLQSLNIETLAKTLNISEKTVDNLIRVGAYWIIDLKKTKYQIM
ncbi:MAG: DeoR family transcriptional regulator [Bacteroidetes bacterium]|nr:DeoR family transcriptional regulator [Bacteroidota bacterium]